MPRRGVLLADGCRGGGGNQLGAVKESVRRWAIQAEVDSGQPHGPTSEELAEIKNLKNHFPR